MASEMNARINHLKTQLLNVGYHGFQVDDMIYDAVGTRDLSNLDGSKADQIVEALTDHLQFALKCRTGKKK